MNVEYIKMSIRRVINMPFYDLKCKNCGREFKAYASITDRTENKIKCVDCGGIELDTVFGNKANIYIKKSEAANACPNISKCGGCCGAR